LNAHNVNYDDVICCYLLTLECRSYQQNKLSLCCWSQFLLIYLIIVNTNWK